ncbi:MAG: iron-containing redox enzyme family protein [Bacteroidota bacterium]|nr:iron-containing redox enzyme family protein [Bacteroidota bacterium]
MYPNRGTGQQVSRDELLNLYCKFPFIDHPLWVAIRNGDFTKEQILKAEGQHYLRTKEGQIVRKTALVQSQEVPALYESIHQTYLEECTDETGIENHLALIKRLLIENGVSETTISELQNTPGNIAAIALYKHIADRGAGLHIIGAGAVEFYYSQLSPSIYLAYTNKYNLSPSSAETYRIHGPMDEEHANRALEVLPLLNEMYGVEALTTAVRDAFAATCLHYDGMYQAATEELIYWNGKF